MSLLKWSLAGLSQHVPAGMTGYDQGELRRGPDVQFIALPDRSFTN